MTEPAPVDLVRLEDAEGNGCVVRVTGRVQPGVLTRHDVLRADVLVSADFVDARLRTQLHPDELDAWQRDLSTLTPGGHLSIGSDRGLSMSIYVDHQGGLSVAVDDPDRLTVAVGIRAPEGWIAEHEGRLATVRRTWPREVVETSPFTYVWARDRR
ncbi:DUF5959 family protein [Yinghuangia seranimata]|uniref:DUF5959 family protein n=1 Tax=Yinghuangia seranimata TaxID=408067 RepID=UPI00248C8E74|nr:DUF5959 family protein [Yinghuangia seranimata]MDI2127651.1 DUF5959 family protein [Yinghuangia seranimata]